MLPGALHGKGWKKASLDLPRRNQGKGKGAEKMLGGQQGSGRGREGNIKLMSTTGSCEGAPGRGRDIKLMPTTRLRGNEGVGNMPKEHQTGRASN